MISVVIPTFNRPKGLRRAVESVFAQTLVEEGFDLILVDNTPDATAADSIAALRLVCPKTINLISLHEPAAGVANARNCAMRAVQTDLVAFLDDDQSAPESWLERLIANHKRFPATVTFGPVLTVLPEGQTRHEAYFLDFFARDPGLETGYIEASFGCGNALIDFSKAPGSAPWFDTEMNEIGGEDDVFFEQIRDVFGRFAWAADAPVSEHPPADRVTLTYTLKRAFSYGQAPITMARHDSPWNIHVIAFWMFVGTAKACIHGLSWMGLSLIRHPNRTFQLDKSVRGIGKLFWWVDLHFYGNAALKKGQLSQEQPRAPKLSTKVGRA